MMQRVVVTGSSGYLGSLLTQILVHRGASVLGIDIDHSALDHANYLHVVEDVGSHRIEAEINEFNPDSIIHCAFVFQPMRNQRAMRQANLGGVENLLDVVSRHSTVRLHVVSSATAYGASPRGVVPLKEDADIQPSEFQYALDKQEIERRLSTFAAANPAITVNWSRPCLVGGPNTNNYMSRFLFGLPFLPLLDGNDTPLQFVHEADTVNAILRIVDSEANGPFNIGPADSTPLSVIAQKTGRRYFRSPYWLCYGGHWLAWNLRLPIHESPPALLEFARHPWLVDSSRLVNELGFQFQYSSDQTLDIMMEHLRR